MGLLISSNLAMAQQKYFTFIVNGKHAITDTLGTEVIKPTYYTSTVIGAKNQIYLQNYSAKPDVIFNTKTGTRQFYESVYDNQVEIKEVPYSSITNKGKTFLVSEQSDKIINLTQDYSSFKNVGQFIIAKFYPKFVPSKSTSYDKKGIPVPPKIEPVAEENIAVLANDETLKLLVKGEFKSYLTLYKLPEEKKQDGPVEVEVVLVNRSDKNKEPNFDYILLSKLNTHSLYNNKMVLVKTFVLAKATEEQLLEASRKVEKQNLSTSSSNSDDYTPVMMVAPSMPRRKGDNDEVVVKKPFKRFFYTEKLANGNTLFALQETEQISNHIFEAKPGVDISLNEGRNMITVGKDGKKDTKFSFNPTTGMIYLPKVYLAQLGLTII